VIDNVNYCLQKVGTTARAEAAEARRRIEALHVLALQRSGELSAKLPKAPGPGRGKKTTGEAVTFSKAGALKDAGLQQQRASEREAIAKAATEEPDA